jgi:hypothetical protein
LADEWISCGEFFRFLCLDTNPAVAAGLIQLEGSTGNLEGRAGRAVAIAGGQVVRLTDWRMPPAVWVAAIPRSTRLQGRHNEYRFEPLLSTITGTGYAPSDLCIAELDINSNAWLGEDRVQISLARIEINLRDAADLGFPMVLAPPSTDNTNKGHLPLTRSPTITAMLISPTLRLNGFATIPDKSSPPRLKAL